MLQAISSKQDNHTLRTTLTSLSDLQAHRNDNKLHLLLGASGSVATLKLPPILNHLSQHSRGLSVRVILTSSACRFLAGQSKEQPTISSLLNYSCVDAVYQDKDEWGPEPWRRGKGVLHIELRKWADLFVIAPLSANTLAKICNGMCDNLLTSVVRAWDTDGSVDGPFIPKGGKKRKRILVAVAMNTAMWRHPITKRHIDLLEGEWGVNNPEADDDDPENAEGGGWFEVLRPTSKKLACGDVGEGAMMEWTDIVNIIETRLGMN